MSNFCMWLLFKKEEKLLFASLTLNINIQPLFDKILSHKSVFVYIFRRATKENLFPFSSLHQIYIIQVVLIIIRRSLENYIKKSLPTHNTHFSHNFILFFILLFVSSHVTATSLSV